MVCQGLISNSTILIFPSFDTLLKWFTLILPHFSMSRVHLVFQFLSVSVSDIVEIILLFPSWYSLSLFRTGSVVHSNPEAVGRKTWYNFICFWCEWPGQIGLYELPTAISKSTIHRGYFGRGGYFGRILLKCSQIKCHIRDITLTSFVTLKR